MATVLRAKLSSKNRYWIEKHRHYELKHFCLQYPHWEKSYKEADGFMRGSTNESYSRLSTPGDPTGKCVDIRTVYLERMDLVRRIAYETDQYLAEYIFKAVTEGLSYTQLNLKYDIPCGKDMYYDRYRRFFWLLNQARR